MEKEIDNYRTGWQAQYHSPSHCGYTIIKVLEFLEGRKLSEQVLDFIHALRPSCIRITEGYTTCDAMLWRVTIYVDKDDIVRSIQQEVEVGLRSAKNGHELSQSLSIES